MCIRIPEQNEPLLPEAQQRIGPALDHDNNDDDIPRYIQQRRIDRQLHPHHAHLRQYELPLHQLWPYGDVQQLLLEEYRLRNAVQSQAISSSGLPAMDAEPDSEELSSNDDTLEMVSDEPQLVVTIEPDDDFSVSSSVPDHHQLVNENDPNFRGNSVFRANVQISIAIILPSGVSWKIVITLNRDATVREVLQKLDVPGAGLSDIVFACVHEDGIDYIAFIGSMTECLELLSSVNLV